MAKIDLNRERGVKPTASAQHGATSVAGYASAMSGMERVARARDNVSRGLMHVSDSLMAIFNDQAETRNRQEILEGQTKIFDITTAKNQELEARILDGEFDNAQGLAKFKEATTALHKEIEDEFNDWTKNNITTTATRNALNEHCKYDAKKNFAHLSGRLIAHDRKRRWDTYQNQTNNAIEDQNEHNLMLAHYAQFGDGSKENPYRYSEEVREKALKEARNKFDKRGLDLRIAKIEEEINPEKQTALYSALVNDVESGKYKGLYASESGKLISTLKKGINSFEYKTEINSCKTALAKDINISQDKFDEWEKATIADINAKEHLSSEEKKYYCEKISAKRKNLQNEFVRNAQQSCKTATLSLLDSAVKGGNGDVDLSWDLVHGVELEKRRANIDEKGTNYADDGKFVQQYDRNFREIMQKIDKYDVDKDKDGLELRGLLFSTQSFSREHRKMLVNALNDKANKFTPDDWSNDSLETFKEQIDGIFDWYDVKADNKKEKKRRKTNPKSVAFYQMRDRIINDVKKLKLSPLEAQEYLQKDPTYRRFKDKQSYAEAVDFLGGMANWQPPKIEERRIDDSRKNEAKTLGTPTDYYSRFGRFRP